MATELANRGIPDAKIEEMGRWKSNAFMSYIRHKRLAPILARFSLKLQIYILNMPHCLSQQILLIFTSK